MNKIAVFIICFIGVISCKKDKPEETLVESEVTTVVNNGNGVFIGSEGNFQFGNASLSYYNSNDSSIVNNIYKKANNSDLGDVLQSIIRFKNKLYLVLNNSGKIEVVNESNMESVGSITGFNSPRFILPVSNQKAYVSDLYSNVIYVVDLNTNTIVKEIKVNGWVEEMCLIYGKVFACNKGNKQLYIIDSSTDNLTDSLTVGSAPSSILEDKNGMLWVMCEGDINLNSDVSSLYQVNPLTLTVAQYFSFPEGNRVASLKSTSSADTLYFLNKGVCRMLLNDVALPSSPLIGVGSSSFYGLGINPNNGDIYVSDAIDYVQASKISRFNYKGELKDSFHAGINSGSFLFD